MLPLLGATLLLQVTCPDSAPLPAYAHNDYDNAVPLREALRLGYAGVEVDLVLMHGALVVAHERRGAKPERTFEVLYLQPLREILQRCGTVLSASRPFLLNLELKESSRAAYDSLTEMLGRYDDLFGPRSNVQPILVGWHPPLSELAQANRQLVRVQQKLTSPRDAPNRDPLVRLISLDYGKTIGRDPRRREQWLAALRNAKAAGSDRIARVYNAPPRHDLYAELFAAGVDLIGTEDLLATKRELQRPRF
jgi:hypothetical protein